MTELLQVQKTALDKSYDRPGFAYFMEMGLGKTLTALSEFGELSNTGKATRMVVLCPNTFKSGWAAEIKKHGVGFDCLVYESRQDYIADSWVRRNFQKPPILIVNYEAIRSKRTQDIILQFIRHRNAYICADESIMIATHKALQTKAAIMLAKEFKYRRILSGKPMRQGPHDYWSQLRFLGALEGVNYYQFRNSFCVLGGFRGKQIVGIRNEERLAEILHPLSFVATKEEWTDLPPKIYTIEKYTMEKVQEAAFNDMFRKFCTWLDSGEVITVDAAITKYMKMAQIQSGFIIDEEGKPHDIVSDNPRIARLKETLDIEVSGKCCIVYHYRHTGGLLRQALASFNPAQITGGLRPDEIQKQKDKFNEDSSCRCILLQDDASKYGHSLVGGESNDDRCSTMIFYENSYSLDTRSQIEDRIHRHGQKANCCVYVDFAGTIIDEMMAGALQRKEDMFQTLMAAIKQTKKAA